MSIAAFMIILLVYLLLFSGVIYLGFFYRKFHWIFPGSPWIFPLTGSLLLILLCLSIIFFPLTLWAFDALVGWELRLPAKTAGYTVTLVQEPGIDFYDSYFEVTRPDGKKASLGIDGDDDRWWSPNLVRKDGKIFFVRDAGSVEEHTPYVDPQNNILSTGRQSFTIAALDFN